MSDMPRVIFAIDGADQPVSQIWSSEDIWLDAPKYHHDAVVQELNARIAELEDALLACGKFINPSINEDYLKERGHDPDIEYKEAVILFYKALEKGKDNDN